VVLPEKTPPGGRPLTVVYIALPGLGFRVCVTVPVFFPVGAALVVEAGRAVVGVKPVGIGMS